MITQIVVPLDGSEIGEHALPYALALARRAGAALTLLHVHQPHMPGAALEALPQYRFQQITTFDDAADADALDREHTWLADTAAMLGAETGLAVRGRVLRGGIAESLLAYAHGGGADLIVMTTHGRGGAWHAWLGSVSDALVRQSRVPVLVVRAAAGARPPAEPRFERVLVPVDGSAFSEAILPHVIALTQQIGAEPTLLHVLPSSSDDGTLRPRLRSTAVPARTPEEYLRTLAGLWPDGAPTPSVRIVEHPRAAAAILHEAAQHAYDLVAMATHGRGGVRAMLLGSTADAVVRGSARPVLLYRPYAAAPQQQPLAASTAGSTPR